MDQAGKVSLNLKNASLTDALNACFKNQVLTYELVDKTIVIKKAAAPVIQQNVEKPAAEQPQDIEITGKILDQTGNPLENVSVVIKGTGKGVYTAADGSFRISVPGEKSVLVISYVGTAHPGNSCREKQDHRHCINPRYRVDGRCGGSGLRVSEKSNRNRRCLQRGTGGIKTKFFRQFSQCTGRSFARFNFYTIQ